MKITCTKQDIVGPLSRVASVANPKSTLPILANVLLRVTNQIVCDSGQRVGGVLSMTCSDMESELLSSAPVDGTDGAVTVPAKKLLDVIKVMPNSTPITMTVDGDKLIVKCGRSRHQLGTLPASEYPTNDADEYTTKCTVQASVLRGLIERTAFAMAAQDVRFYLNGMLLEIREDGVRCVATDGHRMAFAGASGDLIRSVIVPRKAVLEISRMIDSGDVELAISGRSIRVTCGANVATCRLIEGRFPDYSSLAQPRPVVTICDRESLINGLRSAAVLSNDKFRGIKIEMEGRAIKITSGDQEKDSSVEIVESEECVKLTSAYKVDYLIDALSVLGGANVEWGDNGSSAYFTDGESTHVVMCLRL